MSDTTGSGVTDFLFGKGFFQQVVLVLVIVTILFFVFMTVEYVFLSFMTIGGRLVELVPETVTAEDEQITIIQNPFDSKAKTIPVSDNERTGIEFTYSFYLFVNPSTFTGEDVLFHVFHKGYSTPFPLLGPGVFVKGNNNTLRVVMNTYKDPYTYLDIENIPVRKWFHCVVLCRKNSLEVYINGNLRKKLAFEGTLPYQNFQNLILFSPLKFIFRKEPIHAALKENIRVEGAFRGNLSNLIYLPYAASFTEIQGLMNKGVSTQNRSKTQDVPPYLTDTYWTTSYQQLN
jgi:hypothetical protein